VRAELRERLHESLELSTAHDLAPVLEVPDSSLSTH
jgi:hypothetical protein